MKFYNSIGPNPRVVKMYMAERGIEVPFEEVDIMGAANRAEPYLQKNPAGQLPCLELDDGTVLTGKVGMPILGREAKLAALESEMMTLGLKAADTLAMGDGANDLAMIEAAGLGVAYRAKPVVAAAADCGVSVTDLTAVLYFQGYTDSEIVWAE